MKTDKIERITEAVAVAIGTLLLLAMIAGVDFRAWLELLG